MFNPDELELDEVVGGVAVANSVGSSLTSSTSDSDEDSPVSDVGSVVRTSDMKLLNGIRQFNIGKSSQTKFGRWTENNNNVAASPKRSKRSKESSLGSSRFEELYMLTGELLGRGAYASVVTCVNRLTLEEFAVKIIEKQPGHSRIRIIKEIELFHLCAGHPNIVQLVEYFEEDDKFYLVFEKMHGGVLLSHIQRKICFTEQEASMVVRDIAEALKFLHDKGIAHRDLKPENILCTTVDSVSPVKLCDLDLASKVNMQQQQYLHSITTPELQSPVGSAEFMAPEVVDAFVGESLSYDKRCDLWSLGVILYIMLCGYPPFYGECDNDDCGWNEGLTCRDCQDSLFAKIQNGYFDFPSDEWNFISDNAKDLIKHLLIKDANRRYTVHEVLRHPFLVEESPQTLLQTANYLLRNDTNRDVNENFAAIDRIKLHERLSTTRLPAWISVPSTPLLAQQQQWK